MIEWNGTKFVVKGRPDFTGKTRQAVFAFQKSLTANPLLATFKNASPFDKYVASAPPPANGTPSNTNLDHHISISAIEHMVADYLNGTVSECVFLNFVGSIVTPSWLSLADMFIRQEGRVLTEWFEATYRKFSLLYDNYRKLVSNAELAERANQLCELLNSAQQNLRFGDETTNKSVNDHVDARLARGLRLEPVAFLELVWSMAARRPVLSAETSGFLNCGYNNLREKGELAVRDPASTVGKKHKWKGGVAMSESATAIATTTTNSAKPVYGEENPMVSPFRGNIPFFVYSPVGRDTLINLFAITVLCLFMWNFAIPLWRAHL